MDSKDAIESATIPVDSKVSDPSEDKKVSPVQLNNLAAHATEAEHHLRPLQAVKAYAPAVFWSVMVSMCVVMEGYDAILIGNFFAYPTFAKKYGNYDAATNTYQLTAAWYSGKRISRRMVWAKACPSGGVGHAYLLHCHDLLSTYHWYSLRRRISVWHPVGNIRHHR